MRLYSCCDFCVSSVMEHPSSPSDQFLINCPFGFFFLEKHAIPPPNMPQYKNKIENSNSRRRYSLLVLLPWIISKVVAESSARRIWAKRTDLTPSPFAKLFTAPRECSSKISRWVIPRMISHCCSHYYFIWPATVNEILIDEVTIAIRIKVKKLVTFNTASHSRVPPFGCWIKPASHGLHWLLMEEIENTVYTNKCKHKKSLNAFNYIVNKMYFN